MFLGKPMPLVVLGLHLSVYRTMLPKGAWVCVCVGKQSKVSRMNQQLEVKPPPAVLLCSSGLGVSGDQDTDVPAVQKLTTNQEPW